VFYEHIIKANIEKAIQVAGNASRLRPHVKTHKTAEIVAMARSFGIARFKCATVAEAEMLAKAGVPDVLLSYPLYGQNLRRYAHLAGHFPTTKFSTIVDATEGLYAITAALQKAAGFANETRLGIFLDVDIGQHRTGMAPGSAARDLYARIASLASSGESPIYPAGLHCYDGHNHQRSVDERRAAAKACYATMDSLRRPLLEARLSVPEVVMGGTPTFPFYAEMPDVTLSPGTVFLQDHSYSTSFPDMDFAPAALIVSQVVSRNPSRREFCIDLGYKGISADPKDLRGRLLVDQDVQPVLQNEEHWVYSQPEGQLPVLGDLIYVLPTHICPTVALYERAYVVDAQGHCTKSWNIAARDRVVEF
jgi:D-serine deaminase-like pyridoxal phosphate-dependent protein